MPLSMLGVGVLLSASATVFTLLKWLGAAYLIYLGVRLWCSGTRLQSAPIAGRPAGSSMLADAWIVTALNPKSSDFFVAFLPQFLDPATDLWTQMAMFEASFITLAFANALGYALLASRARAAITSNNVVAVINRIGGGLLIAVGLAALRVRTVAT